MMTSARLKLLILTTAFVTGFSGFSARAQDINSAYPIDVDAAPIMDASSMTPEPVEFQAMPDPALPASPALPDTPDNQGATPQMAPEAAQALADPKDEAPTEKATPDPLAECWNVGTDDAVVRRCLEDKRDERIALLETTEKEALFNARNAVTWKQGQKSARTLASSAMGFDAYMTSECVRRRDSAKGDFQNVFLACQVKMMDTRIAELASAAAPVPTGSSSQINADSNWEPADEASRLLND